MLTIRTVNSASLDLVAVVEKVDIYGNVLSPRIRWNNTTDAFAESVSLADAVVPFTESVEIDGYYICEIDDIDGNAENLLILILEDQGASVYVPLGASLSTPGAVQPDVLINFEVEEDRA